MHRLIALLSAFTLLCGLSVAELPSAPETSHERISHSAPVSAEEASFASSDDDVEEYARGRTNAGLDGNEARTRALANSESAMSRGRQFGFPVARDEIDDLVKRYDVQHGSAVVFDLALEMSPETFAGGWLDLVAGELVVAYTDGEAGRSPELQNAARRPDALRVVSAEFTLAELTSAYENLFRNRHLAASGSGIDIHATGVSERLNAVEVSVIDPRPGDREELARIYEVAPSMIVIKASDGTSGDDAAPLGGHSINTCSSGAFGYFDGPFGRGNHLVTAGHCGDVLRHNRNGFPGELTHDPAFTTLREQDSFDVDAQVMNIGDPCCAVTTVVEGWASGDFRLTSVAASGGDFDRQGATVCQAGSRTRGVNNCGQITLRLWNCGDHTNMRQTNYARTGGDSGATVYGFIFGSSSVPLAGIHSGFCESTPRYSFQNNVRVSLGLTAWYTG